MKAVSIFFCTHHPACMNARKRSVAPRGKVVFLSFSGNREENREPEKMATNRTKRNCCFFPASAIIDSTYIHTYALYETSWPRSVPYISGTGTIRAKIKISAENDQNWSKLGRVFDPLVHSE